MVVAPVVAPVVRVVRGRDETPRLLGDGAQSLARDGVVAAVGAAHVHLDGGRLRAAGGAASYRKEEKNVKNTNLRRLKV